MEKFQKKESGINQIIGVENKKHESAILDYFSGKLKELPDQEAKKIEYQKTPEIRELINETIKYVGEFLEQYGIKAVDVSADNIFIYDQLKIDDDFKKDMQKRFGADAGATYLPTSQRILILKDINTLSSAQLSDIIAHELIHLNSFTSYQSTKNNSDASISMKIDGNEINLKQRRLGLELKDNSGEKRFFKYINEAVTEELAGRFCNQFFKEINQLKEVSAKKKSVIEENSSPDEREQAMTNILEIITTQQSSGQWKSIFITHTYPEERGQLNKIIDELWERNKDKYHSREDIFNLFVNAMLHGQLLPLARLVEKSYSKGILRYFGEKSAKEIGADKEK